MLRRSLVLSTLLAVIAGLLALAAPAHAAPVSPQLTITIDAWNQSPTREYGTYVPITAQTVGTNGFNGVPGSFEVRRNGAWVSRGWTSSGSFAAGLWEEDPAGTYVFEFEFVPDDAATYVPETKTVTIVRPKAPVSLDLGSPATDVRAGTSWTLPESNPQSARLAVRAGSTAGACAATGRRVDFTGAGTCTVDVTAEEDANHLAATPRAVTFQVTQAPTVTELAWSADPVLIDEQVDLQIALKAGADLVDGTAEVWLGGQRKATVDIDGATNWSTSFPGAGRYEVEVRGTPTDRAYATSVGTASIEVARLSQSISSPPSPAYVGDTWRPTASGGGTVSVSSHTTTVCDVADGQVTFRATGSCQVDSSVGSTATYEASDRSDSFNVVRVPAVVETTVVPLSAVTQRVDVEVSSVRGIPTGTVALDGGQATTLTNGRASLSTSGAPGQTLHAEIAFSPTPGSRWAAGTANHELVIPEAPQPLTISEPPAHLRVGQSWTPTIAWSPSGRPTSWTAAGACERVAGAVSFTAAGDCTVTAVQSAGDGYLEGRDSVVVAVQKGLQSITLAHAAPGTAYVGGRWAPLASGGPSGRPVEVTAAPGATCDVEASIEGGVPTPAVRFRAPGECTVTFAQQGTADYEAGGRAVTIPVVLVPVELTVAAADDLAVGAEGTLEVTATADGEVVPGEVTVEGGGITVTGTVGSGPAELAATFARAGTHTVTVSFAPADRATYAASSEQAFVDVAKGVQTITTGQQPPATAQVGESWPSSFVGGASGETVTVVASGACTRSGSLIRFTRAGICTLAVDQAGNADWLAAPTVTTTTDVGLVPVDVVVTVPDDARVGEATALDVVTTAPGTVEVVVDGQTLTATGPTLPVTFTKAGEREAEVSFTPTDPATHRSYAGRTTLMVAKGAQQLSLSDVAPSTQRAGDTWTPAVAGGDSGSPVLVAAAPAAVCTADSGTVRFTTAGDCEVMLTQAGSADYDPAPVLRRTISVERRTPTVSVELPGTARVGEPAVVTMRSDEEGTVRFALDDEVVGDPVAVTGGAAAVTLLPTAAGERRVSATFSPRAPGAVAAAERQVTLEVGRAPTSTVVAVGTHGLTATVTPTNAAAGVPSGDVTFFVDDTEAGVVPLVEGRAILPRDTAAGTDLDVRASYSGSTDHEPSSASTVRTNPVIAADVTSSAPARAGWYTGPVVVRFTCTRGSAELVEPCPAPVRLDRDGLAEPVTRSVATRDGGRASVRVDGIRIDSTAPQVRILGARDGATHKAEARTPRCAGSDALSGLAGCQINQRRTGRRAYEVTATATDVAGNTTTRTLRYRITRTWLVGLPGGSVVGVTRGSSVRLATLGRTTPTVRTSWGQRPRVQRFTSRAGLPRWTAALRIPRHSRVGRTYVVRVQMGGEVTRLRLRVAG